MKSFFSMERGEAVALGFLLVFSAITFLPVWREVEVGGMVLFGWLMAALMVLSPALAIFVFVRGRRRG